MYVGPECITVDLTSTKPITKPLIKLVNVM